MPSTKSKTDNTTTSTRQMLDELDALMERMLALPVNDLDEAAQTPLPRPTLSATLTVIDAPDAETQEPPPTAEPLVNLAYLQETSDGEPASAATQQLSETPDNGLTAPSYPWGVVTAPSVAEAAVAPLKRPRRSFAGWVLSPVIAFNRGFDGWLERFGFVGAWFRRPSGRLALGIAGLGMLASAIAWFLYDLASWTR
jgi:hypothetical protein